jgi:hypothetical protein
MRSMPATNFVFPVRYVSEGVAVQTTSRELSALGIAVRSLQPPHVGARVSMALYLPNTPVPEVAIARVARDGANEFWADFLVVDPQARMRIASMLQDHSAKGQQRAFERYEVKLKLHIKTADDGFDMEGVNLSRSGIFARTQTALEVGLSVECALTLPGEATAIVSAGIVAHRQSGGVGIQFVDASDGFRERIDKYMNALARKS